MRNGLVLTRFFGFSMREISAVMLKKIINQQKKEKNLCYLEYYERYELPQIKAVKKTSTLFYGNEQQLKSIAPEEDKHLLNQIWIHGQIDKQELFSDKHVVFFYQDNFSVLIRLAQEMLQSHPLSFTLVTEHAFSISPERCHQSGSYSSLRFLEVILS